MAHLIKTVLVELPLIPVEGAILVYIQQVLLIHLIQTPTPIHKQYKLYYAQQVLLLTLKGMCMYYHAILIRYTSTISLILLV